MTRSALIVFGKRIQPGSVKTRLMPELGAETTARLYAAFVADSLHRFSSLGASVRLYLYGQGSAPPDLPSGTAILEQQGSDLGERMLHALAETFAAGYERAVIIGTDHPTLPAAFIREAFGALNEPRSVVIGPAEDGGYYLIGMNDLRPEPFRGMTYSRPDVFEQTLARLRTTKAALTVLPYWYDVDDREDLDRLADELTAAPALAPRTFAILQELTLDSAEGE